MTNLHLYPSPFLHESRILRETETLSRHQIFADIVLVGIHGDGLAAEQVLDECRRIVRMPRGQFRGWPEFLRKVLRTLTWSWRVYRRWGRAKVECVNCHSLPVLPLAVGLKWRTGARLVFDAHELETETNGLRGVRKWASKMVERALIKRADDMIVVGDAIADWYRDTYKMRRPTVVLNCPRFVESARSERLREKFGLSNDKRIFLYQGALAPGRGVEALLSAFREISDPDAVLVLLGYGELSARVQSAAETNANIFFHPAVAPESLLDFTASADVGVALIEDTCISYHLCLPNKLFEYLMAGVPVLVSNVPEMSSLVLKLGVGVVASVLEPSAISRAVESALKLDLKSLRRRVSAIRQDYCWEAQEPRLLGVYERMGLRAQAPDTATSTRRAEPAPSERARSQRVT
jgi:glycosyltransferase involved in cell wall biosynthesis